MPTVNDKIIDNMSKTNAKINQIFPAYPVCVIVFACYTKNLLSEIFSARFLSAVNMSKRQIYKIASLTYAASDSDTQYFYYAFLHTEFLFAYLFRCIRLHLR